jgi:hypothetical protein
MVQMTDQYEYQTGRTITYYNVDVEVVCNTSVRPIRHPDVETLTFYHDVVHIQSKYSFDALIPISSINFIKIRDQGEMNHVETGTDPQ